jgi:hypothetical protein
MDKNAQANSSGANPHDTKTNTKPATTTDGDTKLEDRAATDEELTVPMAHVKQALSSTLDAAHSFEKATDWRQAAAHYARAAELSKMITTSWPEAVQLYEKAMTCAERHANEAPSQKDMFCTYARGLARMFSDMGRPILAGRRYLDLAKRLENVGQRSDAILACLDAEREFVQTDNRVSLHECMLKRADLTAIGFSENELSTAIFLYETTIRFYSENSLLRYNARDCIMHVVLLSFARECVLRASSAKTPAPLSLVSLLHTLLLKYEHKLPETASAATPFQGTHQHTFLTTLATHHDARRADLIAAEVAKYDRIYRLPPLPKRLLHCIQAFVPKSQDAAGSSNEEEKRAAPK